MITERETRTRIEVGMERELTPFVGRGKELTLLGERLAEVKAGRGQIVLLVGEPGVGKSRLLHEFQNAPGAKDFSWLAGKSISFGNQMAYFPIIDLLKRHFQIQEGDEQTSISSKIEAEARSSEEEAQAGLPFLKHLLATDTADEALMKMDAQERRVKTFEALRNLVLQKAQRGPLVLVVEDLHWADRTSEDFLVSLADSIAMAPVLMLLSYRPSYRNPFPERSFISRLMLQQLSDEDSLEMATRVLTVTRLPEELRKLVIAKAEGNPFFVEEMIKSLLETGALQQRQGKESELRASAQIEVPDTIQDVIMSRIDRLEESPRKALQLASVIGREFAVNLLESIADLDEPLAESLQKLKSLELIYERSVFPEQICFFKHALTQEVTYKSLLPPRQKELHRLVAGAIEKAQANRLSEVAAVLAYHYERGEEWERALEYLRRAAKQCREIGAHREETIQLSRAMTIAQRLGQPVVVTELRGQRGAALVRVGMWAEARADLETTLNELPAENMGRRAELLSSLAAACFWMFDTVGMQKHAAEGHALAERAGRDDLVAVLLAWLGASQQSLGELGSATEYYERAIAKPERYTSAAFGGYPLTLYWKGRCADAVERGREAAESFRNSGDHFAATFGHPHLGLALAGCGRYSEAARVFDEARQMGLKLEVWPFHARAVAMSAGFHLDVFDFKGNELLAEEARERGRSSGFQPSVISANLDLVFNFARRGDVAEAESLAQETAKHAAEIGGWHRWLWELRLRQARAEIACARGDWAGALHWARETVLESRKRGRTKYVVTGMETEAKALAALGQKAEAILGLHAAVKLSRAMGDPALFLRVGATLLAIEGDDNILKETRSTAGKILADLPSKEMQDRFRLACEAFRLGSLESAPKASIATPIEINRGDDLFRTTHWSIVQQAGGEESTQARAALANLCETYWYPLYVFVRRQGHSPEDAQDLVQGFFAVALEKDYFQDADRARGKFRSFLLLALKRYMANAWNRANRLKRGGGRQLVSIDAEDTEARYMVTAVETMTSEQAYEKQWALTLLQQTLDGLEAEFFTGGKANVFQELKIFLSGDKQAATYAEVGQKLEMTEGAVKIAVHRLRKRYRELLKMEIAHTVSSPEAVDEEIRSLFAAFS